MVSLTWLATNAQAAISVGPSGSAVQTFNSDVAPPEDEFATGVLNGDGTTYSDTTTLEAGVQTITAPGIPNRRQLPQSNTLPPSTFSGGFRHNTNVNGHFIQSRPTTAVTNAANILLATLQNDSGAAISALRIAYDFNSFDAAAGELPGLYVYWSLSGAAGSWAPIAALSGSESPGSVAAAANVGSWPAGTTMFILWVDDNANGITDPSYTLDNVVFSAAMNEVRITSPTNNQRFAQGLPITINAEAILPGNITQVEFFDGSSSIGVDNTAPYSIVFNGATLGSHQLTATATDDQANTLTSSAVTIQVVANVPPTVMITNLPSGNVLVGENVVNTAVVSDTDGTVVTNVDWFLDGVLRVSDATSPFTFQLGDVLAGTHTVRAVATDNLGASASANITVTATNPLGVALIITNGSTWKYLDDGSDQGTFWVDKDFPDSTWSMGPAELGYGDIADNRPETTVVNRVGSTTGTTNATTYFRHHFNVTDPTAFGELIVRLLRDDGAIVYLNGMVVFRSSISNEFNPVLFNTFTPPAVADDGTVYQITNADPALLVVGDNVVAVEIHQASETSSDISFDLMLWGPGPKLIITRLSSTQVEVSWKAPATGFVLQSTTSLSTPSWSAVSGVTSSGGFNRVTVTTSSATRFFRLRGP